MPELNRQRKTHRAKRILAAIGHRYPTAWAQFEQLRRRRSAGFTWPDWCYMPIAGGLAVVDDADGGVSVANAPHAAILAALGAWRMTQGIYRFDPAIEDAVLDTPLDGNIPAEHLQHLPEWCVYLDLHTDAAPHLHGAWVHMEYDFQRHGQAELRIVFDSARDPRQPFGPEGLTTLALPLVGTLDESLHALATSAKLQAEQAGFALPNGMEEALATQRVIARGLLALTLYLCSTHPDITRREDAGAPVGGTRVRDGRSAPTVVASAPTEWDVGVRIGAALRSAYAREQAGSAAATAGRHVRPHVRRAHWHTIVSGARRDASGAPIAPAERDRELRWLPPIPVAVDDLDTLPAVVHPVRR